MFDATSIHTCGGVWLCGGRESLGDYLELETPVVVENDSAVLVEFLSADAGDIYFLGASIPTSAGLSWTAAADTGFAGLGQLLFGSGDVAGERVDLGTFAAGSVLHFGLRIDSGVDAGFLDDVMRSDVNGDVVQFGWDEQASGNGRLRLGWDNNRDPKDSDWDYNDAAFDVIISPGGGQDAPAPGGAMLLGFGGVLAAQRRR